MEFEPRFLNGVFLGLHDRSDEILVWGPEGVRKARTIRRRPIEEQWKKEEVLQVQGTPLRPNPDSEDSRIKTRMTPGLANNVVLGDPVTRKRYDAMLAWCAEPDPPKSPKALWSFMVPWVTDPTSAVAVKLLREMSGLRRLRDLPLSPLPPSEGPTVVPLPTAESSGSGPHLQVVDGTPEATQVLRMFEDSGSSPLISTEDLTVLIASLGYCGALLREVRERKGLSIQDVVDQTAIPEKYLDALERDARRELPGAAIFVEGYLRTVADVLGLEATALARGYLTRLEDSIDTEPDSA